MDPVTILGAVGSVVGIAGFGLQLAQFLDTFIEGYASAPESLEAILETLYSTSEALEQVQEFLKQEKKNVERGGQPELFSAKALAQIRKTSDKCLKIFWKIEAVILRDSSSDLDDRISRRLIAFHAEIEANRAQPVIRLDTRLKLSSLMRWRWSFSISRKLDKHNDHLHRLQTTLILMFQVISLQANLIKPDLNAPHLIHRLYEQIPYVAAQSDLPQARMSRPPSYPYPTGPPPPHGRDSIWIDDTEPAHFNPPQNFAERANRIRENRFAAQNSTRRRSMSSTPERDRGRNRYRYPGTAGIQRRHSHSGDDRRAVRRDRDRGVRSSSSERPIPDDDLTVRRMFDRTRAARRSIAVDRARGRDSQRSSHATTEPGASHVTSEPSLTAGLFEQRPTTSAERLSDNEIHSTLPQQGTSRQEEDVKRTMEDTKAETVVKLPVQYQKPSVSDQSEEKEPQAQDFDIRDQRETFDFESTTHPEVITTPTPELQESASISEGQNQTSGMETMAHTIGIVGLAISATEPPTSNTDNKLENLQSLVMSISGVGDTNNQSPIILGWTAKEAPDHGLGHKQEIVTGEAGFIPETSTMIEDTQQGHEKSLPNSAGMVSERATHDDWEWDLKVVSDLVYRASDSSLATQPLDLQKDSRQPMALILHPDRDYLKGLWLREGSEMLKMGEETKNVDASPLPSDAKNYLTDTTTTEANTTLPVKKKKKKKIRVESVPMDTIPENSVQSPKENIQSQPPVKDSVGSQPSIQNSAPKIARDEPNPSSKAEQLGASSISPEELRRIERKKARRAARAAQESSSKVSPDELKNGLKITQTETNSAHPEEMAMAASLKAEHDTTAAAQDKPQNGTKAAKSGSSTISSEELAAREERRKARRASRAAAQEAESTQSSKLTSAVVEQMPEPTFDIQISGGRRSSLSSRSSSFSSIYSRRKPWYKRIRFPRPKSPDPAYARADITESKPWYKRIRFSSAKPFDLSSEDILLDALDDEKMKSFSNVSGTENSSISPDSRKKRELVWDLLKRMAHRDYQTQDYIDEMSLEGCFITAFVIKGGEYHEIPYNGQFMLRKSDIRNLETATWWKEFAFLLPSEISSLKEILADSEECTKLLMRLKWLRKIKLGILPTTDRVLVAMVRNTPLHSYSSATDDSEVGSQRGVKLMPGTKSRQKREVTLNGELEPRLKSETATRPEDNASRFGPNGPQDDLSRKFILYAAYTIRVFEPYNHHMDPKSVLPTIIKEDFSEADIMRRISELDDKGPQLIEKKLKLLTVQQDQITKLLEQLSSEEINTVFAWTLAQIDDINISSEGLRPLTVYLRKVLVAATEPNLGERHAVEPASSILPATQLAPQIMRAMPVRIPPEPIIPELNSTTRKGDIPSILRPNVTFEEGKKERNIRGNSRADSSNFLMGNKGKESTGRSATYGNPKKNEKEQSNRSRSATKPMDVIDRWPSDDTDDSNSGVLIEPDTWSSSEDSYARRETRKEKKKQRPSSGERQPIPHLGGTTFPTYPPYGYPSGVAPPFSGMYPPYPGMTPQYPYAYPTLIPQGYVPPGVPFYGTTNYPSVSPYNRPPYDPTPYPRASPVPPVVPDMPYGRDVNPFDDLPQRRTAELDREIKRRPAPPLNTHIAGNSRGANRAPPGLKSAIEINDYLPDLSSRPVYTATRKSYLGASSTHGGSSYPQYGSADVAIPSQRPKAPYPKYYDDRAYNPLDLTTEEPDKNDIVQKLLMDWTPAGTEYRERSERSRASGVGDTSDLLGSGYI